MLCTLLSRFVRIANEASDGTESMQMVCKQGIADLGLFIRDQGHGVMKHGVIVCGTVGHDASQW